MAKFHSLKVKEVRRETAEAVSVSFDVPAQLMADYQFKQGQYLTLKLKVGGEEIRRSYSICTSPFSEKDLRIAVKEVEGGRASTYINRQLKAGDVMEVMTPMGNFHSPLSGSNKKNYVLFAGGSGITPMMSILKSVLYIEKQSTVVLFYANRDEQSVIFDAEVKKLAAEYADRLKVIHVYDKPSAEINELYKGFITPEKVIAYSENHIGLNLDNEYFICGPGPMMENVKQGLEKLKVDNKRVHIEYFTSVIEAVNAAEGKASASGEAVNSEVTVIQYGVETTFKLNTNGACVLDAALDAGVDVPYSCKGAVCCTCRAKIIEGKAKMDANFALTDSEVEDGFILTCQAHPLTEKLVVDYDAM
jgi:ring-1,2-phenylacetyl-CoA epoxidase subunit PaaE